MKTNFLILIFPLFLIHNSCANLPLYLQLKNLEKALIYLKESVEKLTKPLEFHSKQEIPKEIPAEEYKQILQKYTIKTSIIEEFQKAIEVKDVSAISSIKKKYEGTLYYNDIARLIFPAIERSTQEDLEIVKILITEFRAPWEKDIAMSQSDYDTQTRLIVNFSDEKGETALFKAIRSPGKASLQMMQYLLEKGARPYDMIIHVLEKSGYEYPFDWRAIKSDSIQEVVQKIIPNWIKPDRITEEKINVLIEFITSKIPTNIFIYPLNNRAGAILENIIKKYYPKAEFFFLSHEQLSFMDNSPLQGTIIKKLSEMKKRPFIVGEAIQSAPILPGQLMSKAMMLNSIFIGISAENNHYPHDAWLQMLQKIHSGWKSNHVLSFVIDPKDNTLLKNLDNKKQMSALINLISPELTLIIGAEFKHILKKIENFFTFGTKKN